MSSSIVSNCRYGVSLGMPLHFANNPHCDYKLRIIKLQDCEISLDSFCTSNRRASVKRMSIKRFKKFMKKRPPTVQVFHVFLKDKHESELMIMKIDKKYAMVNGLLRKYETVFESKLPASLPLLWPVDHKIEVELRSRPTLRPLCQLSCVEIVAGKAYVEDILKKGMRRRSQSPYGAPLCFVKHPEKLGVVAYFRALNCITKPITHQSLKQIICSIALEHASFKDSI